MENEVLPNDFTTTVNDIKLAILKARARAAQAANAEVLKLYFFVGGYISKRRATPSGAQAQSMRFQSVCKWNCQDCADFRRAT